MLSKSFFSLHILLLLSLVFSSTPLALGQSKVGNGRTLIFETKEEMITASLSGRLVNQCPLKIEDALYDPTRDLTILTRNSRKTFTSIETKQLIEGPRLAYRLQRHFGTHVPQFPVFHPIPDLDIDDERLKAIDLDKCTINLCELPNPPSQLCGFMDRLK